MNSPESRFAEVVDLYLEGKLTTEQGCVLLEYITSSSVALKEFRAQVSLHQGLKSQMGISATGGAFSCSVMRRIRVRGQSRVFRNGVESRLLKIRRQRSRNMWWGLAAAGIVLLVAGVLLPAYVSQAHGRAGESTRPAGKEFAAVVASGGAGATIIRGDTRSAAQPGERMYEGDHIQSLNDAVVIRLADSGQVDVAPGTEVVFGGSGQAVLSLKIGRITVAAAHREAQAPPIVDTTETAIYVRGTRFSVVARPRETRVEVEEGSVLIRAAAGTERLLTPGEHAVIDQAGFTTSLDPAHLRLRRSELGGTTDPPWLSKTVRSLDDLGPLPSEARRSPWGGCTQRKFAAEGAWRTMQRDGRWWLIDPDGYALLHSSIGHFAPPGKATASAEPFPTSWLTNLGREIHEAGFTGMGPGISPPLTQALRSAFGQDVRLPEVLTMQLVDSAWLAAHAVPPADRHLASALAPLLPDFPERTQQAEKMLADRAARGDVMAVVGDLDIPWRLLSWNTIRKLAAPGTPLHGPVEEWLTQHGSSLAGGTEADARLMRSFCRTAYLRAATAVVRRAAPGSVWLGPILTPGDLTDHETLPAVAEFVDAIGVLATNRCDHVEYLSAWYEMGKKPLYLIDIATSRAGHAAIPADGVTVEVETQADRGRWYQHVVLTALASRCVVGWSWRQDQDAGDPVDPKLQSQPIQGHSASAQDPGSLLPLLAPMSRINGHLYGIVEAIDKK